MSAMLGGAAAYGERQFQGMAKYLYGFADPDNPGRGPPANTHPTVIATFKLTQDVATSAYTASWNPWFPSTAAGTATRTLAFMRNQDNAIAVMICPQPNFSTSGASSLTPIYPNNSVISGVTFDPTYYQMNSQFWDAGASGTPAKPSPLAPFSTPMPSEPNSIPSWAAGSGTFAGPPNWRTVGLRTVLTVTTPAMTAQGTVSACDNRDFFAGPNDENVIVGGLVDAASEEVQSGVTNGSFLNQASTLRSLGGFVAGAQYECVWLPANDRAMQYYDQNYNMSWVRQSDSSNAPTQPWQQGPVLANNLLNSACNVFVLRGLATGTTFRLQTVWSVEIPINPVGSLALFVRNARLATNFTPDWSALSCMNAAGLPGDAVACLATCGVGTDGMQMAILGHDQPATREYVAGDQGPTPATAAAAHGHGMQMAETIGGAAAAQLAMSSTARAAAKSWGMRLLSGAKGYAGRAAMAGGRMLMRYAPRAALAIV